MGCFDDCTTRQLTGLTQALLTSQGAGTIAFTYYAQGTPSMTVNYCESVCKTGNFKYAGINYG